MSKIISVHSFRGGTGKSNTTANIAFIVASRGLSIGVIHTDIQSPRIHVLFGLQEDDMKYSLNDYLCGKADVKPTALDVTHKLGGDVAGKLIVIPKEAHLYLIPSSMKAGEI